MSNPTAGPTTAGSRRRSPQLVGVELRRWWWRRLTRIGVLLAVGIVGLSLYSSLQSTRPPTAAERVEQQRMYQQASQDFPGALASCREAEAAARDRGEPADFGCAQMEPPTPEMFQRPTASVARLVTQLSPEIAFGTAFLVFLVGASFVAAEFRTGSIATWLTFEPRRTRVAGAKLLAAAAGSAAVAVAISALTVLGVWSISVVNASDTAPPDPTAYSPVWSVARSVLLVTAAGLGGAVVGLLVRSTAAVIGILVGYAVIVEGLIGQTWRTVQPWLLQPNVQAWLQDGYRYTVDDCTVGPQGYSCSPTSYTLTLGQSAVFLVVLGVVLPSLALLTFRRRDVGS